MKVPIGGICFLRKGEENKIRRLEGLEAVEAIVSQTLRHFSTPEGLGVMLSMVESLAQQIPVFELINKPEPEAAFLSHRAMTDAIYDLKNEDLQKERNGVK